MKTRILVGLLGSAVLAACAAGVGGSQTGSIPLWRNFADHPAGYLGAAAPKSLAFLTPPPEATSPRGQSDLALYRATRALEGSARWSLAVADADLETPNAPAAVFGCALGTTLSIARQPVLMRLLARAAADTDQAGKDAKAHYQRPRPFLTDDGRICVAKEDWLVKQGSYPSGHSAAGTAWALILAELAPAKADALTRRGLSVGESRVVCGVHYASDVEAGRTVGAATVARLKADPGFVADMVVAKAELSKALAEGLPPPADRCRAEAQALATPLF